jgi:hypothetical protein
MTNNSRKEGVPVVEDLHVLLVELAVVRNSILWLQTRHAQPSRPILARENAVGLPRAVHFGFARNVEDGA